MDLLERTGICSTPSDCVVRHNKKAVIARFRSHVELLGPEAVDFSVGSVLNHTLGRISRIFIRNTLAFIGQRDALRKQ